MAGRQASTSRFWDARKEYDLYVSPTVLDEAQVGDQQAVALRVEILNEIPLLEPNAGVALLANALLNDRALPSKAGQDAMHIAYAAWYRLDAIVSWNFRHIASAWARHRIESALRNLGYSELIIATPDELTEEE